MSGDPVGPWGREQQAATLAGSFVPKGCTCRRQRGTMAGHPVVELLGGWLTAGHADPTGQHATWCKLATEDT